MGKWVIRLAKKRDMKTEQDSWRSVRGVCIVKTLAKLGHYPIKTTKKEAWFLSPLRSETQASFNVSLNKNLWYDFGLGEGGNVIDLVMAIQKCSLKEAFEFLQEDSFSFSRSFLHEEKRIQRIKIIRTTVIQHKGLQEYLLSRGIPLFVAKRYCKEVWYKLHGKIFFSIGLRNQLGGWELRNKYYKSGSSPKSYTFFSRYSSTLVIVEGMFDFLSLNVLDEKLVYSADCLVLNSLTQLKKIQDLLPQYKEVLLYLDNDLAGQKATRELLRIHPNVIDKASTYSNYSDLNEWLTHEKK